MSAFGNGMLIPFLFLYLHNVRGIGLGVAGLVVATNAVVSIVAGPVAGPLVDRYGGRRVLAVALVISAVGYRRRSRSSHVPWQGFLAAAVVGVGTGFFWPAQSTLLAALSPPDRRHATFAMQRVMMNLGIGLGALVGGLIADVDRPGTFVVALPRRRGHVPRSTSAFSLVAVPESRRPRGAAEPRAPGKLRPGAPARRVHGRGRAQHAVHLRGHVRLRAAPGVREERSGCVGDRDRR